MSVLIRSSCDRLCVYIVGISGATDTCTELVLHLCYACTLVSLSVIYSTELGFKSDTTKTNVSFHFVLRRQEKFVTGSLSVP